MEIAKAQKRYATLDAEKKRYIPHWKEIAELACPDRGVFDTNKPAPISIDYKRFIDTTIVNAVNLFVSGLQLGIASPNREWFRPINKKNKDNKVTEESIWLNDFKTSAETLFATTNTYLAIKNILEDAVYFGTGCAIAVEDKDELLRFEILSVGEYVLANGANSRVDTIGREFYLTIADMVEKFGLEVCSDIVKMKYKEGSFDELVKVYHLITPNRDVKPNVDVAKNKNWLSLYWEEGGKTYLRESGYDYFPVLSLRYSRKRSSEIWGVGVCTKLLGDLRHLLKLQQDKILAVDLMTSPPMQGNSSIQGEVNLNPKGLTRFMGTAEGALFPVDNTPKDIRAIDNAINEVQKRIEKALYNDVFAMMQLEKREKTVPEVEALLSEKMLQLGPLYETIKYELLPVIINIGLEILIKNGIIEKAPATLEEFDIDYLSMVAISQKASALTNINTFMSLTAGYAQLYPEIKDHLSPDKFYMNVANLLGIGPNNFNTEGEVDVIRKAQAQANAEMLQQQQIQQGIATAKEASQVDLEKKNLLTAGNQ
jgi:hypothetical protein